MIDHPAFDRLKLGFLAACGLDYQLLGGLVDDVRDEMGSVDADGLHRLVNAILYDLVSEGLVEVGTPEGMDSPVSETTVQAEELERVVNEMVEGTPVGWNFRVWPGDSREVLDRIETAWRELGHDPGWNEVCWFRATEKGKERAAEWRAGQYLQQS